MPSLLTAIMQDTRRALQDGTYPIKLRITFNRQRKYYLTDYSLTIEDFAKTQQLKARGEYKEMQVAFQALEQKALTVIKLIPAFTFYEFEKRFLTNYRQNDVFEAFENTITQLRQEDQVGTASSYECAANSLLSFLKKEPLTQNKGLTKTEIAAKKAARTKKPALPFNAITVDFLKEYEKWMLNSGRSRTTIGIYLRPLRALINAAIDAHILSVELYPFGKRKYQIPGGRNVKKALPLTDIEQLFNYEPKHDGEAKALDLWRLTYLCSGINMKDLARLKYRNLTAESITFVRAKTERTTKEELKPIVVTRTPEINQIIEKWGNQPKTPDTYVFPILSPGLTAQQELNKVRQVIKTTNTYVKKIAAALNIEKKVTTYTARHSFSTILRNAGAPIGLISESLGHANEKTTQNYLDSFEDNVKKQFTSQLLAFKNKKSMEKDNQ